MKNRNLTAASVLALLIASGGAAIAADLFNPGGSLKDPFTSTVNPNWGGFHLGVNGGYGWDANSDVNATGDKINAYPAITSITGRLNDSGWLGGAQVGYDAQIQGIVVGVEVDADLANINDDSALKTVQGTSTTVNGDLHSTIDWLASIRARAGLPLGGALVYGTGGLAIGGVSARATSDSLRSAVGNDETATGWVAGGGLEYKLSDPWSMKVEYLHYDLGKTGLTGLALPTARDIDNQVDVIRVGLNFHTNFTN